MRAVRERAERAEQARARRPAAPGGIAALIVALVLSAAVVGVGVLRRERPLDAGRDARPATVTVNLSAPDRQRLDGWAEFFACHGVVSDLVMTATLRANGDGAWTPERPIQLELAPSADQPPPTYKELEVLNRVTALTDGSEDLAAACAAKSETPAAPGEAAEERP